MPQPCPSRLSSRHCVEDCSTSSSEHRMPHSASEMSRPHCDVRLVHWAGGACNSRGRSEWVCISGVAMRGQDAYRVASRPLRSWNAQTPRRSAGTGGRYAQCQTKCLFGGRDRCGPGCPAARCCCQTALAWPVHQERSILALCTTC